MQVVHTQLPVEDAARAVARKIASRLLSGQTVLWLLSGGSGLQIALQAARLLRGCRLDNLLVSMGDERYGSLGHADENWQKLLDAGLQLPGAQLYRPLIDADRQVTAQAFETWLSQALDKADYSIGIFGVGADGHTAGIKPDTSATAATGLVADFTGHDFERITMTFKAIGRLDEAVVQISGDEKLPVLEKLSQPGSTLDNFPAGILHQVPGVELYTDLNLSAGPDQSLVDYRRLLDFSPPYVIMMVGIPGSGKSTITNRLETDLGLSVLSADQIRQEISGDEANQEVSQQAWRLVYSRARDRFQDGQSVIIDAVHTSAYFRRRDIERYRSYGARSVIALYVPVEIQTALERNAKRARIVPDSVISRMYKNLQKDPPRKSDGFDEVIVIDKGSTSPTDR